MSKYLTEFIGTFFLVLTIGLAVEKAGNLAPLAIGSMLVALVYMGGHISGAQYNPAVSLAVLIAGKQGVVQFVGFVVVQLVAAVVATVAVEYISTKPFVVAPGDVQMTHAYLVEVLYTFALALVVLNVAVAKKTEGNSFYGLAIGFTVAAGAFSVGSISGGAFKSAVGLAPCVVNMGLGREVANLSLVRDLMPLYLIAPLIGGALAGVIFRVQESGM